MSAIHQTPTRRGFGSDNHAPVHPKILAAMNDCNQGHSPSYGTDPWSQAAMKQFQWLFGKSTESFFVFNGTGANVCALKACLRSFESVICTDVAHINVDECAAPESVGGIKLVPVPHVNGKLTPQAIESCLVRGGDQHFAQPRMISITQPTELGTLYSLDEIRDLVQVAKKNRLLVHMDGARFANACVALGQEPAVLTTEIGIDILSFGGTKNGLMFGEAVVVLNPELAVHFGFYRKQLMQLPSKCRYVAAQFLAYFQEQLWIEIAQHSLNMAQQLKTAVKDIPLVEITQSVQSNAVFAKVPKHWVKPLRNECFFYVWDEKTTECRWMTAWDTQSDEIERFTKTMRSLS